MNEAYEELAQGLCQVPSQETPPAGGMQQEVDGVGADLSESLGVCGGGPWEKLLTLVKNLASASMMTPSVMSSLMVQFLPVMARRARRKQSQLNRWGAREREILLPLSNRILGQLDMLGLAKAKPGLEEFVSGHDTSKFGECISQLLSSLDCVVSNTPVAKAMDVIGEDLVDLLPRLLPEVFEGHVCQKIQISGVCHPSVWLGTLRPFTAKVNGKGKSKGRGKHRCQKGRIGVNENDGSTENGEAAWHDRGS